MKYILGVCFFLGWVASARSLDREAFTFTKYDLEVRLEPQQQRLAVRGTIVLRNNSSISQKNACLQISSSLTWRSIQAEGKPLQFVSQTYESDIDHTGQLSEAIVMLPKELAPGGVEELTIGYEGVVVLDASRLTRVGVPNETAIHSDWDQISPSFSAVRGIGNVVWYPVATESANLSEGNSVFETLGRWKKREQNADMGIAISQTGESESRPTILLCSGKGQPRVEEKAQRGAADCSFSPLGLRVPTFVLAQYEVLEKPQITVFYRQDHQHNAEKFAQAAEAVAPFVSEWFGAAREKVRLAELFDPQAFPYETGSMLLTPLGDTDAKLVQIALVHEMTHAAFPSPRTWIFEGLAHFSQAVYRERQENRKAALDLLASHRASLLAVEKELAEPPKPEASHDESLLATAMDEFSRSKAAYVWWMLRDMLGEDALKRSLANYRSEQDSDPQRMQRLLEAQSKRDLQWFFDDWVYRDQGLPEFRVESAFSRKASQDNYLVTITVENLGRAGAEVPVTVRFDGGELSERVEVRAMSKGVVRVATPKPPLEVMVNDGSVPESDTSNNVFKVVAK